MTEADIRIDADAFRALTLAYAGILGRAFRSSGPDASGMAMPRHPEDFDEALLAGAEVAVRESLTVARALGDHALERRFLLDTRSNFVLAHAEASAQALGMAFRDTGNYSVAEVRARICPLWPFC
jgi:hypothetical protein